MATPKSKIKNQRSADEARNAVEVQAGKKRKQEPAPSAPKRPIGRPPKPVDPADSLTPPPLDPATLPPGPRDSMGGALSPLWDSIRHTFPPSVIARVDALVTKGKVKLDDLIWIELANMFNVEEWGNRAKADRTKERARSLAMQSRKHLGRLLELANGGIGGANDIPAQVPKGLSLDEVKARLTPSTGDDVLGEPKGEELPEVYR